MDRLSNASEDSGLQHLSSHDASLFAQFGLGKQEVAPFQCVHHAFEYQASQRPEAIAIEHLDDSITYAELDRKANGLAHQLRAQGIRPGSRVCLLVQRSISMVIGIMAVLKTGAAYVPLDGSIVTQSTLDFVLVNSKAAIVLALPEYINRVSNCQVLNLQEAIALIDGPQKKPEDLSSPDDSVYIIYTSGTSVGNVNIDAWCLRKICLGTTGTPKGVEVMHRNVTNCASCAYYLYTCADPSHSGLLGAGKY